MMERITVHDVMNLEACTERAVSGPGYHRRRGSPMVLGFTLGIIYLVLLLVFAVLSFRKGHWVLGLIGFIFPVLWIIGAILPSRYAHR
jgi:hypothetical protein